MPADAGSDFLASASADHRAAAGAPGWACGFEPCELVAGSRPALVGGLKFLERGPVMFGIGRCDAQPVPSFEVDLHAGLHFRDRDAGR